MKRKESQDNLTLLLEKITGRELIDELLEVNSSTSGMFAPTVKFKDKYKPIGQKLLEQQKTELGSPSTIGLITDMANTHARNVREVKYRKTIKGERKLLKVVSEGDSWFQYPILIFDIIDRLIYEGYAILSLGAAGDTISDMLEEKEFMDRIKKEKPHVFMFSSGGNDMLGSGRLNELLHKHRDGRRIRDYPNAEFKKKFKQLEDNYQDLISKMSGKFPNMHILVHGYDYPIPRKDGKYLRKPMESLGIKDADLQTKIIKVLVDRFNKMLKDLSGKFEMVSHIDCRGCVPNKNNWGNEIHPNGKGFKAIAEKFRPVLDKIAEDKNLESGPKQKQTLKPRQKLAKKQKLS